MLRSRRLRWRALAILGWALLFITIIIGCPICLAIPTRITSLNITNNSLSTIPSSTSIKSIKLMPELQQLLNFSCLTGNTSSSNVIYNISNFNCNISNSNSNNNNNINNLPYNLSNQKLLQQNENKLKLNNNQINNNNNKITLAPPSLLNNDNINIDYTTIRINKLNSIYSKRRRKKLLIINNNDKNFNNLSSNNNNNSNLNINKNLTMFRINSETLRILRTYPNSDSNIINNNTNNNNNSDENSTELNDISTLTTTITTSVAIPIISTTTIEPLFGTTETSTILQLLLSRTDRSIHQSGENIGGVSNNKRNNNNVKRNRLNSNLDRNERSANLSHISGGSARKIQLYIKNRFIQLMPDGTINGTQDDLSDYTILQRTTVDIGQIKIQGVATCLYLCMDQCGSVYGSKVFTDDCVFNESMEQHHYNTYSSTYNSNSRRTLYLALNRHGEPRKLQIPPSRSLGKLATYTKSLTSGVPDERVEKLIAYTFGANRIKHGLRQLCDAGKPLINLTSKLMKKRPKCQNGGGGGGPSTANQSTTISIPINNLISNSSPITTAAPTTTTVMALSNSEKSPSRIINSSNNSNNRNANTNSNNSHNSNNNNNNNASNINSNSKKRKKKRKCRVDEPDNENCQRGGPQAIKKKHHNQQQKLKCNNNNQNSSEIVDCQQRQKKNINNNNSNNNKKVQGHGPKQNGSQKKNRQQNGNKNGGNNNNNNSQIRNVNRARNSANSARTTIASTSRHHRHMHTSTTTTTTINPITLIQMHITTTELNNFNINNDHQYQQDDDDISLEINNNNDDIHDDGDDNDDDDDEISSISSPPPPLISGQQQQFVGDADITEYDDEFDVIGVELWNILLIFWIATWLLQ